MKRRRRGCALRDAVVIGLCLACAVPAAAAGAAPRTEILLNGMWEVNGGDVATWTPVRVPEAPIAHRRRVPLTYRLRFTLPAGLRRDRRVELGFDKAGHRVRVTLNGHDVGEHYGVRLPFSFDVTTLLREGGENELVVQTLPLDAASARPGGVATADEAKAYDVFLLGEPRGWYPAGIFGDVVLRFLPAIRIDDVFVRTSFRERTIAVSLEVANGSAAAATVTVGTQVLTLDGTATKVQLHDQTITLAPGARATVEQSGAFPDARPWPDGGSGTPPLYVARASLSKDATDLVTRRFGFREVWADGRDLVLNGRRLPVAADITIAFTERERLVHLFSALRSVGVNVVRLHWDDGTQSFYDVADETGMVLMPGFYCSGPPPLTAPVVAPRGWVDDMGRDIDAWIALRRGHPSIALWAPYDIPPQGVTRADLDGFERRVRAADPTLPILSHEVLSTSVADPHRFVSDASDPMRVAYEALLARAHDEGRPLLVGEVAKVDANQPADLLSAIERFGRDGVVGFGGLLLEQSLFRKRLVVARWPSASGHDAQPRTLGDRIADVVNWSDPTRPAVMRTAFGRLVRRALPKAFGTTAAPLAFVRAPELLVVGPTACGGRGYALAAPTSGAGAVERATLLDPDGKGWLVLTEPGTYRVRVVCGDGQRAERATTVEARGRPFTGEPGFGHLQEVRLDATAPFH